MPKDHYNQYRIERGWQATAKTGKAFYAAYGSNLNLRQMSSRCPNAKFVAKFRLMGWKLVFRGVADIVKDPKASVPVGVFEITPQCELALDRYEGFPSFYGKECATLRFADGSEDLVMFYTMNTREYLSAPNASYFDCIVEGYGDCGMSDREMDALFDAANDAAIYERKHMRDSGFVRDARGRYVRPAKTPRVQTSKGWLPSEAVRRYDQQEFEEFCQRHGFDATLVDDEANVSDLIHALQELEETNNHEI